MNKLVFVLPSLSGGGAEKFVINLYHAMEQYQGYDCHIVILDNKIEHAIPGNMQIHVVTEAATVSKSGIGRLTYRKKLAQLVDSYIDRAIGSDCVILSNMFYADKVMSESRHRVLHVIHSAYTESLLTGKNALRKYAIKRNINKVYGRHPLIFVSEGARMSFQSSFHHSSRQHVIYNPIPKKKICELAACDADVPQESYLVHVGRFNREKRHDRLLQAFAKAKTDLKLLLIGDGKLKSSLLQQIEMLGLDGRVDLIGFTSNPYPYIKRAKALLLTSDFEGLPTAILEAMCLNTPIVALDCPGGIREILEPNSPSLVCFDNQSKLVAAIDNVVNRPEDYTCDLPGRFDTRSVASKYAELLAEL